jgi:ADP-heptose:LPS heptosyltransferase
MSNILIIKHGSLGDIVQISGILRDIRENLKESKISILTTSPYHDLLKKCPYVDDVLIDQRKPRWNIFYLLKLKKILSKYNFLKVYDLQNSSRTSFYRKYLLKNTEWSSTETILEKAQKKSDFDNDPVLKRFVVQLKKSNIKTKYSEKPDFSWAVTNADHVINKYFNKKFILVFPFCSSQNSHKQWPFFNDLIKIINSNYANLEIATVPGPKEIKKAKEINIISITNNETPLNIMQLAGVIVKSSYVISNDTGPAHMTAHLDKSGTVIFGPHTSAKKVSIETDKFNATSINNLNDLSAEKLYLSIKGKLDLIN